MQKFRAFSGVWCYRTMGFAVPIAFQLLNIASSKDSVFAMVRWNYVIFAFALYLSQIAFTLIALWILHRRLSGSNKAVNIARISTWIFLAKYAPS